MHAVQARVNLHGLRETYLLHAQCNARHQTSPVQSQRCFQGTYVFRFEKNWYENNCVSESKMTDPRDNGQVWKSLEALLLRFTAGDPVTAATSAGYRWQALQARF